PTCFLHRHHGPNISLHSLNGRGECRSTKTMYLQKRRFLRSYDTIHSKTENHGTRTKHEGNSPLRPNNDIEITSSLHRPVSLHTYISGMLGHIEIHLPQAYRSTPPSLVGPPVPGAGTSFFPCSSS
ncbi:unnamed protein product, partial [Ectocarpus sp. 12 AP-2014]